MTESSTKAWIYIILKMARVDLEIYILCKVMRHLFNLSLHFLPFCLLILLVLHQSGPVLVPAGVIGRPLRHKIKTMKLAEVTKPLSSSSNTKLQSLLFKRLMRCDKVMLHGEGPKHRMRILTVLSGCISHQESDGMIVFTFSLLFSLYIWSRIVDSKDIVFHHNNMSRSFGMMWK